MAKLIMLFFIMTVPAINIVLKDKSRRADVARLFWTASALVFVVSMVYIVWNIILLGTFR